MYVAEKVDVVRSAVPVEGLRTFTFEVPTDRQPESDGTLEWSSTTMVVVEADAGGETGVGYSYTHAAAAHLIDDELAKVVRGQNAMATTAMWQAMRHAVRNLGRPGLVSTAIAAVDAALWDLKARLLGLPLFVLLGASRERIMAYGSGGFTSYSNAELSEQLAGWARDGFRAVKMKVGRHPEEDLSRVEAARAAVGDDVDLFVDANGAFSRKEALRFAQAFAELGVVWFEEPVSSDDLDGLRLVRDRATMDVAAGEYGYDAFYFRRMLEAGAVDVLQADATRCAGISGFLRAAALCEARSMCLSAHTAPTLHAHACCGVIPAIHVEYFHDHVRLEHMLLEGALSAENAFITPDPTKPGLGIGIRWDEAERYQIYGSQKSRSS